MLGRPFYVCIKLWKQGVVGAGIFGNEIRELITLQRRAQVLLRLELDGFFSERELTRPARLRNIRRRWVSEHTRGASAAEE
jgi:hypothetical protein